MGCPMSTKPVPEPVQAAAYMPTLTKHFTKETSLKATYKGEHVTHTETITVLGKTISRQEAEKVRNELNQILGSDLDLRFREPVWQKPHYSDKSLYEPFQVQPMYIDQKWSPVQPATHSTGRLDK